MSGPINGSQIIIRVDAGAGLVDVAFQRDASFDGKNKLIDTSNKLSGRRATYLVGRQDEDVKLSMLFSDDASYDLLKTAFRNGDTIQVARFYTTDTNPSGTSSFTEVEQADAVITDLSEKFKDQDAAMADVSFKISGDWA
jgi:predicted secreted protein